MRTNREEGTLARPQRSFPGETFPTTFAGFNLTLIREIEHQSNVRVDVKSEEQQVKFVITHEGRSVNSALFLLTHGGGIVCFAVSRGKTLSFDQEELRRWQDHAITSGPPRHTQLNLLPLMHEIPPHTHPFHCIHLHNPTCSSCIRYPNYRKTNYS